MMMIKGGVQLVRSGQFAMIGKATSMLCLQWRLLAGFFFFFFEGARDFARSLELSKRFGGQREALNFGPEIGGQERGAEDCRELTAPRALGVCPSHGIESILCGT